MNKTPCQLLNLIYHKVVQTFTLTKEMSKGMSGWGQKLILSEEKLTGNNRVKSQWIPSEIINIQWNLETALSQKVEILQASSESSSDSKSFLIWALFRLQTATCIHNCIHIITYPHGRPNQDDSSRAQSCFNLLKTRNLLHSCQCISHKSWEQTAL